MPLTSRYNVCLAKAEEDELALMLIWRPVVVKMADMAESSATYEFEEFVILVVSVRLLGFDNRAVISTEDGRVAPSSTTTSVLPPATTESWSIVALQTRVGQDGS